MFRDFLSYFNENIEVGGSSDPYHDFIHQLGGKNFGNGLFNSLSEKNIYTWTENVNEAYPEFAGKFAAFGYDWLGRCFGIDLRKDTYGNVLMFEIGANDVLEIPSSFLEFLNKEIPMYPDACLAREYYFEWQKHSGQTIRYGYCVGYKIPLFLGGEDCVENLEVNDVDVYWSVLAQIKKQG